MAGLPKGLMCSGLVWRTFESGPDRSVPCANPGTMHYLHRWYCGTHYPPVVESRWTARKAVLSRQLATEVRKASDRLEVDAEKILTDLVEAARHDLYVRRRR